MHPTLSFLDFPTDCGGKERCCIYRTPGRLVNQCEIKHTKEIIAESVEKISKNGEWITTTTTCIKHYLYQSMTTCINQWLPVSLNYLYHSVYHSTTCIIQWLSVSINHYLYQSMTTCTNHYLYIFTYYLHQSMITCVSLAADGSHRCCARRRINRSWQRCVRCITAVTTSRGRRCIDDLSSYTFISSTLHSPQLSAHFHCY